MTWDPVHARQATFARPATSHWVAAFLVTGTLLAVGISVAPPALLVAARSLMFSKFVADGAIDEGRLNDMLRRDGVIVMDTARYGRLVDRKLYDQLSRFAKQHVGDDTALARQILLRMSPGRSIGGCGAESLGDKVAMVAGQTGCCSDYTAAFQVYAGALGLPARRVETETHTTVEYFDHLTGNWIWVDPLYRLQATDKRGQLLSHYQVREHLLEHQSIHILELFDPPIALATYHVLFDATHYAVAYWYPPTDLLAADEFDEQLRRFHVMRPIRQLASYLLGVRPSPAGLASPGIVHRLRIESGIGWFAVTLSAISLILLTLVVATRGLRQLFARRVIEARIGTRAGLEDSE